MKRISKKLLEKSTDAFVLSIEIYNKPTIRYRIEGFAFFFVNAWELLNKAKIIEDTKKDLSIYYYCRPTKIQKLFKSPLAAFLSAFFLKFKKHPLA